MNRKAEINMYVLGGIIAAIILVIVLVGPVKDVLIDFGQNFFNNAPGYKEGTVEPVTIGLTRYDIQDDKVQIYDGERWNAMQGEVAFEGLRNPVSDVELTAAFDAYYFNSPRTASKEIMRNSEYLVTVSGLSTSSSTDIQPAWYEDYWTGGTLADAWAWLTQQPTYREQINYRRGNIVLTVWNLDDAGKVESIGGFIFIGLNSINNYQGDTLYVEATSAEASKWFGDKPEFTDAERATIYSKSIVWRDSIFVNPEISIQGAEFCINKQGNSYISDNRYISIDLNQVGGVCE